MKIKILFLLLSFVSFESFSQVNKSKLAVTNVHHYQNNISLKNFDGTRSTIHVNGSSATLFNPDGTQSRIDLGRNTSTLTANDGTISSISHNRSSSTINNPDGTQIIVSHMNSTSTCFTANGKHMIMHTFGNISERRNKNKIDVLIHMNWLKQKETSRSSRGIQITACSFYFILSSIPKKT